MGDGSQALSKVRILASSQNLSPSSENSAALSDATLSGSISTSE